MTTGKALRGKNRVPWNPPYMETRAANDHGLVLSAAIGRRNGRMRSLEDGCDARATRDHGCGLRIDDLGIDT